MAAGYPLLFLVHSSSSLTHTFQTETSSLSIPLPFPTTPGLLEEDCLSLSSPLTQSHPILSLSLPLSFFPPLDQPLLRLCDSPVSQRLRKFLILPRSRLVKTHTVTAQLVLNQPPLLLFLLSLTQPLSLFFGIYVLSLKKKTLRAGGEGERASGGKNSIHPISRGEQAESVRGRRRRRR